MRRRPPPEVDPDRLRSLLASARPRPEPTGRRGWVPSEEPPAVESGWFDERPGEPGGESGESEGGLADSAERADGSGSEGGRHRPPPRVLTMPVALRGARVAVSVRAVVAFVVVLVVAVVFFAVRVARAQQAAAPQPVPAGEGLVGRTSVAVGVHLGRERRRGGVRRGGSGRVADVGRVGSRLARAARRHRRRRTGGPPGRRHRAGRVPGRRRPDGRRRPPSRCGRAAPQPGSPGRGRRAGLRPTAGRDAAGPRRVAGWFGIRGSR